jgi:hypothetical protein
MSRPGLSWLGTSAIDFFQFLCTAGRNLLNFMGAPPGASSFIFTSGARDDAKNRLV